jgi:hypothetical protein
MTGAETQARTGDIFLFREALYQLSYLGIGIIMILTYLALSAKTAYLGKLI